MSYGLPAGKKGPNQRFSANFIYSDKGQLESCLNKRGAIKADNKLQLVCACAYVLALVIEFNLFNRF